jgi:hypothetical protein
VALFASLAPLLETFRPSLIGTVRKAGERNRALAKDLTFFAEDVFGNQFAWDGHVVLRFVAETGARQEAAKSAREWSERVRDDQDEWLNRWLLEDWKAANGPLAASDHLVPKVPFCLGSAPEAAQLLAMERYQDMRFKGSLAWQLKDVPPGGKVRFKITD